MKRTRAWRTGVLLGLGCGLTVLTGCWEHTIHVGAGAPAAPAVYDHWENYWLGGLIGHKKLDVRAMCPSGNATIESKQTFLNGLVTALTSGIYAPWTLRVRCRAGRSLDVELNAAEVEAITADPRLLTWIEAELPDRLGEAAAAQDRLADR